MDDDVLCARVEPPNEGHQTVIGRGWVGLNERRPVLGDVTPERGFARGVCSQFHDERRLVVAEALGDVGDVFGHGAGLA